LNELTEYCEPQLAGVLLDPKFTNRETDDILAAIQKVYPVIARS
jgi:hypothetical protein